MASAGLVDPCVLYVVPIPASTTTEGLTQLFEQYGELTYVRILSSKNTAFVAFNDPGAAAAAKFAASRVVLPGADRALEVRFARKRNPMLLRAGGGAAGLAGIGPSPPAGQQPALQQPQHMRQANHPHHHQQQQQQQHLAALQQHWAQAAAQQAYGGMQQAHWGQYAYFWPQVQMPQHQAGSAGMQHQMHQMLPCMGGMWPVPHQAGGPEQQYSADAAGCPMPARSDGGAAPTAGLQYVYAYHAGPDAASAAGSPTCAAAIGGGAAGANAHGYAASAYSSYAMNCPTQLYGHAAPPPPPQQRLHDAPGPHGASQQYNGAATLHYGAEAAAACGVTSPAHEPAEHRISDLCQLFASVGCTVLDVSLANGSHGRDALVYCKTRAEADHAAAVLNGTCDLQGARSAIIVERARPSSAAPRGGSGCGSRGGRGAAPRGGGWPRGARGGGSGRGHAGANERERAAVTQQLLMKMSLLATQPPSVPRHRLQLPQAPALVAGPPVAVAAAPPNPAASGRPNQQQTQHPQGAEAAGQAVFPGADATAVVATLAAAVKAVEPLAGQRSCGSDVGSNASTPDAFAADALAAAAAAVAAQQRT